MNEMVIPIIIVIAFIASFFIVQDGQKEPDFYEPDDNISGQERQHFPITDQDLSNG